MKFWDNAGDPSCFAAPLPDCLFQVSFSRYSPISLEVVEKPNKCKSILTPAFSGGTTPTYLRQIVSRANIVSANYHPPFGKVWLSSVCWSLSVKPGNEVECRIYREWVKTHFHLKPFVYQSSCSSRDNVRNPSFANALARLFISCFFRIYRPLKLPLSCEVV